VIVLDIDGVLIDNLFVPQGTTFIRNYPVTDPISGALINTAGWTLRGQVRLTATSAVLYEWKAANSNVVLGNGFVQIKVLPADSDAWTWIEQAAKYDLELQDAANQVQRISKGDFTVTPSYTH
jgi:hypothetical protein